MRKELAILFLIVVLSAGVFAEDLNGDSGDLGASGDLGGGSGTAGASGELGGGSATGGYSGDFGASGAGAGKLGDLKVVDTSGVQSKSNEILAKEIKVPEAWKILDNPRSRNV